MGSRAIPTGAFSIRADDWRAAGVHRLERGYISAIRCDGSLENLTSGREAGGAISEDAAPLRRAARLVRELRARPLHHVRAYVEYPIRTPPSIPNQMAEE